MIAIGLRAHPKRVTFAVVSEADPPVLMALSQVRLPAALHPPEQLSFVRKTLLDLIREFDISSAGVRTTEPVADRPNLIRVNIEGVIQELLGAGAVPRYFAGPLATIGRHLGMSAKETKLCASGASAIAGIDGWNEKYDTEQREALLSAMAALRVRRSRLSMLTQALQPPADLNTLGATFNADDEGTHAD